MKKLLVIGLAVLMVLAFSGMAIADRINTNWSFTGAGELSIDTDKYGGPADGTDYLHVETYGSSSSGWNNVSATGPHSYWDEGTDFQVHRRVEIEDGCVETYTVRSNHGMPGEGYYWHADTEYGTYLEVDSSGTLEQHFSNSYFAAHMNTDIWADGSYEMSAMTEGQTGGYFFFGIGADGDGEGDLWLNTTDYAEHNGTRCLQGLFQVEADSNAGFGTSWGNEAHFAGYIETPSLYQTFDVDVDGPGGDIPFDPFDPDYTFGFEKSASAEWVVIEGYTYGGTYVGIK